MRVQYILAIGLLLVSESWFCAKAMSLNYETEIGKKYQRQLMEVNKLALVMMEANGPLLSIVEYWFRVCEEHYDSYTQDALAMEDRGVRRQVLDEIDTLYLGILCSYPKKVRRFQECLMLEKMKIDAKERVAQKLGRPSRTVGWISS